MAQQGTGGHRTTAGAVLSHTAAFAAMRSWTGRRWRAATAGALGAFVLIGEVGQTLPPASIGRMYPVLWWNWVILVASAMLLGLIIATFVDNGERRMAGSAGGSSAGAGAVAAVAMACPGCSPLAVPLLGTGGLIAVLQPIRGWIAFAAVLVLALTLLLRLRAASTCPVALGTWRQRPDHGG